MEPDSSQAPADPRDAEILFLRRENELLRQKLDLVLRRFFGKSSEKLDPAQLELLLGGEPPGKEPASPPPGGAPEEANASNAARIERKPRRERIPDHLPVVETVLDPEPVKACPEAWRCIGSEVTEQLDYEPGRFLRRRLVRRKYVCLSDKTAPPVIAPLPAALQDACIATPGLIAEIIVNKHAWHQPLYRQESIFKQRHGVSIPRQTMMNWEAMAAHWLLPLHRLLQEQLLASAYLQVDETPVRYLDPGKGKTGTGYFWICRAGDGTLFFDWRPSRAGECLDRILRIERHGEDALVFRGVLQCDGYAAYQAWRKAVPEREQDIELAACWAHARRKLHEALESSPRLAGWLIRQIGHLYAVERRLRGQRAGPALREALRSSESRLIYQRIGKAVTLLLRRRGVTPKSPLGMALRYIHGLWPRLGVFLRDGRVEADTNLVENAIRPTAVGKRNWLFVGSAEGGWKAAVFHTLIGNCRRLGIDPHAYLKDVLERLPSTSQRDLPGLLPAAWAGYGHLKKAG